MEPRNPRVEDSFDADLKRALEMSLEESSGKGGTGFVPQSQLQAQRSAATNGASRTLKPAEQPKPDEEDDPELKAAIAASLKDMEEQKKKHAATLKQHSSSSNGAVPTSFAHKPEYELTPAEAENISLFSTLVERLQHQPPGTILREPQIQELYESIGKLRPKLARTYGETMSKHDTLLDLHAKLATVVRYYDRMLEERLSSTYNQQSAGYGYAPNMRRPQSSLYPSISSGVPSGMSGGEDYYSSNAPSDPYARPQSSYSGYQQQAATSPYMQKADIRAPMAPQYPPADHQYQQPQQYSNQTPYPSTSTQQHPPSAQYPQTPSQPSPQMQRRTSSQQYPPQPQQPPSSVPDDAAAYYSNQAPQEQYQQPPQQQQQTPQWQQQQQPWQQPPQQGYAAAGGYGPDSFPAAPQHQPPQPKVEEALIEL